MRSSFSRRLTREREGNSRIFRPELITILHKTKVPLSDGPIFSVGMIWGSREGRHIGDLFEAGHAEIIRANFSVLSFIFVPFRLFCFR